MIPTKLIVEAEKALPGCNPRLPTRTDDITYHYITCLGNCTGSPSSNFTFSTVGRDTLFSKHYQTIFCCLQYLHPVITSEGRSEDLTNKIMWLKTTCNLPKFIMYLDELQYFHLHNPGLHEDFPTYNDLVGSDDDGRPGGG